MRSADGILPRSPIKRWQPATGISSLKYLIIESVAAKPHLETAGEIALEFVKGGNECIFAFLGHDLEWTDCSFPGWLKWIGCSYGRRIKQFERIIANHGVTVEMAHGLPKEIHDRCVNFARGFSGGLLDLKGYRYQGAWLGMGVASSLISWAGDSEYDISRNPKIVRSALLSAAITFERALLLIGKARPQIVVTFNGRFATCRPIVEAALSRGIQVLRHDRGATFDKYEVFKEPIHSFSYIKACISDLWKNADKSEREKVAHSFFLRRRNGDGIGWHSFVAHQIRGHVPARIKGKRRLVYFSSSDDEYAAVSDVVSPCRWGGQIQAVKDLISVCEKFDDIELLVRVHPHFKQKSSASRARWDALGEGRVRVITAESQVDTYALLDSADIVVTYGSTIGIEAAYWGKPSILLGPSRYSGIGICIEPANKAELGELLSSSQRLPVPLQADCLPYGYYYMTYGKRYRFYRPESLSEGTFLGQRLSWDVFPINMLRKVGLGKLYTRLAFASR